MLRKFRTKSEQKHNAVALFGLMLQWSPFEAKLDQEGLSLGPFGAVFGPRWGQVGAKLGQLRPKLDQVETKSDEVGAGGTMIWRDNFPMVP